MLEPLLHTGLHTHGLEKSLHNFCGVGITYLKCQVGKLRLARLRECSDCITGQQISQCCPCWDAKLSHMSSKHYKERVSSCPPTLCPEYNRVKQKSTAQSKNARPLKGAPEVFLKPSPGLSSSFSTGSPAGHIWKSDRAPRAHKDSGPESHMPLRDGRRQS